MPSHVNPTTPAIWRSAGRVGRWRGGLGTAYLLPALSFAGASTALPCSVSTLPLIKPDVRFSRIRLSDKDSCVRPRDVAIAQAELGKSQLVMQVFVGEACVTPTPQLVFPSQPLTDPLPGMVIDPSIGFIDWAFALTCNAACSFPTLIGGNRLTPISRLSPLRALTLN